MTGRAESGWWWRCSSRSRTSAPSGRRMQGELLHAGVHVVLAFAGAFVAWRLAPRRVAIAEHGRRGDRPRSAVAPPHELPGYHAVDAEARAHGLRRLVTRRSCAVSTGGSARPLEQPLLRSAGRRRIRQRHDRRAARRRGARGAAFA